MCPKWTIDRDKAVYESIHIIKWVTNYAAITSCEMILPWFGFKFSNLPYLNKWYFSLKFKIHFPVGNSDLLDKSPFWVEIKKIRFLGSTLNVITLFWKNLKNTFVDKSLNQLWLSNWYSAFTKELWSECLCYSKTAKIPKHVSPGIDIPSSIKGFRFINIFCCWQISWACFFISCKMGCVSAE